MKFRYIFLLLIVGLPLLITVGYYRYNQTVNKEEIQFKIPIIDDYKSWDTIILNIKFEIPKYYSLKKYIYNRSDCITCGDQKYVFYKNPTEESIGEKDSLIYGFYGQNKKGREIDSVILSVITYRNIFQDEIINHYSSKSATKNQIARLKAENPDIKIKTTKLTQKNGVKIDCIEYGITSPYNYGQHSLSFISSGNTIIVLELQDLTFNNELSLDFFKTLQSVQIKVEYKGENENLMKLLQTQ